MIYLRNAALLAVLAVCSATRFYKDDPEYLVNMWQNYKKDFGKVYHASEETYRYAVFVKNLELIDDRNTKELAAGGEAVHGLTRFADLTPEEFTQQFLGADASFRPTSSNAIPADVAPLAAGATINQDWTGIYTTPVKNQGQCGSCWAFSATEQIESDTIRTLGTTYILSPQQVVSCTPRPSAYGCSGGWTESAYDYVNSAGGIEKESDYSYVSPPTGKCKADSSKFVVTVDSYYTVSGESAMANYVGTTGPLSVCLDASNWSSYTGGVMTVCGNSVDHCVQAVGVNTDVGGYWKVRNSWGVTWGESGYIRLAYGKNTCAITNDPTYATVHKL